MSTTTGSLIAIEGLAAGYDRAPVIRGLDLTVGEGEVVALLGANGAGKTTTLRAVSGLVRPMQGAIRFQGQDLARVQPSARNWSTIAQLISALFSLKGTAETPRSAPTVKSAAASISTPRIPRFDQRSYWPPSGL